MTERKQSIFHIDANSAFLSWTALDLLERGHNIDIRNVPSAIAGDPKTRRGIILAKSHPAKKYDIHTGETLAEARRKCPELTVFPPDYRLYLEKSNAMYALLCEYSDIIERYSIDECYVDYTASVSAFGDPVETAACIKERIKNELGFTVNVGVSVNKLLAKMASEFEKPDKLHTLFPEEIPEKMWGLPIRELFFCGRKTEKRLSSVGLSTIGQVAHASPVLLESILKPSMAKLIREYANGIDESPVCPNDTLVQKSVGNSTTLPSDVNDVQGASRIILAISERVAGRLRKIGVGARVVSVTLRNSEFNYYRHQMKLDYAIDTTTEIYESAMHIFKDMWRGDSIRQIGVHLGDFSCDDTRQISIFDKHDDEKLRRIDKVVDAIRSTYGERAVHRGVFTGSDVAPVQGGTGDGNYLLMDERI